MSRSRFIGLVLTAALSSTALTAFDAAAQGAPPAPPVQVATPLAKRITNWDEFTGRFEASEQVDVRARVSGFIESVHFRRSWSSPADIGHKSVAVNLADVEAMGGTPVAMVISLGLPADLPVT